MIEKLYTLEILSIAANINHIGLLKDYTSISTQNSTICGSRITISLKLDNRQIIAYGQEVKACLLAQASAAILSEVAIGSTKEDIEFGYNLLKQLLDNNIPSDYGKFHKLSYLKEVYHYPERYNSVLLPFETCLECLKL